MAKESVPCYSVISDLFDQIDNKKDSLLDIQEWNQAFGTNSQPSDPKLCIKSTPLAFWENTLEAQ